MIKVAGYCRVSTDSDDQVNSFESQKQYFRAYIENHPDWELYEIYADEGITGTSTKKRTQFNRMIHDACLGKFRLIITKEVSRFSRNILDTIRYTRELRDIGIGVIFLSDRINTLEPEAEMLLSFLASLAQEESRRTSSRVVWGQTRQMEKGVVFGRSLLGYDVKDGAITLNEDGAKTVRLIFHKYGVEQVSTTEIARFLTERGYRTSTGKTQWKSSSVIKILRNEKYAGDLVQKKTYTPDYLSHEKRTNRGEVPLVYLKNHHEPIITREIWDIVQDRLRINNKHRAGDGGHSNRYIFSGKIICGECGCRFVSRVKYLKDGTKKRRWSCGRATNEGAGSCDVGKLLRDDDGIQMLTSALRSLPMDFDALICHITELTLEAIRTGDTIDANKSQQIEAEIERMKKKKESVLDSYFSGEISIEDMRFMTRKYDGELESLYGRKIESDIRRSENRDVRALSENIQSEVSGILNGDLESEVFLKSILENLTVFKDRHMELRLKFLPHVFYFTE